MQSVWAELPAVPAAPLHPGLAEGKKGALIRLRRAGMGRASYEARNWVKVCPAPSSLTHRKRADPEALWGLLPGGSSEKLLGTDRERLEVGDRSVDWNPTVINSVYELERHAQRPGASAPSSVKEGWTHLSSSAHSKGSMQMRKELERRNSLNNDSLKVTLTCEASVFSSIQWARWAK